MAAGNMKTIKRRIKSVGSTKQITKAMELVASSKLRKAKKKEKETRPFFEAQEKMLHEIYRSHSVETEYAKHRGEVKNSLYIVIAGDKGLAGGYNSNVFKKVGEIHGAKPWSPKIFAIGKKAVDYFEKRDFNLVGGRSNIAENIKSGHCSGIARAAIEQFVNGEVDEVKMFYTKFVSSMVQETKVMQLLPLVLPEEYKDENEPGDAGKQEQEAKSKLPPTYDPSPDAVFHRIVPNFIAGLIQSAITESYTSELSARQTAMESASENAEEMIDRLSLLYNRARQEKITNEINEIVGGANAL
ncbi:MAG: ATP synthase F1 subunit gamma [Oscillospiraceae bacterium]|nr:ATP synthase F1 subunit gamma [Oscillospiraceae bacterium]